jgi:hypothetical protein
MLTPWIVRHAALIRFGSTATFRFYDPCVARRIRSIPTNRKFSQPNPTLTYSSLPILPITDHIMQDRLGKTVESIASKLTIDNHRVEPQ